MLSTAVCIYMPVRLVINLLLHYLQVLLRYTTRFLVICPAMTKCVGSTMISQLVYTKECEPIALHQIYLQFLPLIRILENIGSIKFSKYPSAVQDLRPVEQRDSLFAWKYLLSRLLIMGLVPLKPLHIKITHPIPL